MNNIYYIFFLLAIISCDRAKENNDISKLENDLLTNSAFVYTSDEKYLAETLHEVRIDEKSNDTTFTTSFLIYQTSKKFQDMYDFDKECDLENLLDCSYDEILHDFENYILKRKIVLEESLANYFVSYGVPNSAFMGELYFIENDVDTTLVVEHFGTKLNLKVFDQSEMTYKDLYSN